MLLCKCYYFVKHYRNQWKPAEWLADFQFRALKNILLYAKQNVPYYRRLFKSAGFHPEDFHQLADLAHLPITSRDTLVEFPLEERISTCHSPRQLYRHRTGGSSGKPLEICWDRDYQCRAAASLYRMYYANGYRSHYTIANVQFHPPRANPLSGLGLFKRIDVPYTLSLEQQLCLLASLRPNVIQGYPSRIAALAEAALERRITTIRPKLILVDSEALTPAMREIIKGCFLVEPTNVYESWEFGTIAWECPQHQGLHINADQLIVEVIKDSRSSLLSNSGEVVITALFNKGMPFIRYAIGDTAVLCKNSCSCGRTFPMLAQLTGRSSEMLVMLDGCTIQFGTLLGGLMDELCGVREYQCVQSAPGQLEIYLVATQPFPNYKEHALRQRILRVLPLQNITIKQVASIEKSPAGKLLPFVSKLQY